MQLSPDPRPSPAQSFAAAAITIFVWAAAFPVITLGVREVEAIPLAAARFATAALAMGGWLLWRRPRLPRRSDLLRVLACGALGIALYNILLNTGQRSVSPGAASFIVATQPVFAAALSRAIFGERFGIRAWSGTLLGLVGVAVIAAYQPGGLRLESGAVLVLGAAACSGTYFVLQRPLVARYGAMTSAAMTIIVGAALLGPWLPRGAAETLASPRASAVVLFLGLGAGVLGYATWMVALAGLGAARAANLLFLMAPLAALLSIPLTGVWPGPAMIAGGALALAGVAVVNAR